MTLVDTLIALVRATIPELNAIEWTNPRLTTYLDREYQEWAAELGKLPGPGWFTITVDFAITANATTYALTGLLNPTTQGSFAAIKTLYYLPEQGEAVRVESAAPGQEQQYVVPTGTTPPGQSAPRRRWLTRPAGVPTLNVPIGSESRNFRAYIRYKPPTLAYGVAMSVQSDPCHDDVLVLGTALRALLDTSETDPVVKSEYREKRMKFLEDERLAAGEFESETTKVVVSEEMFG